MNETTVPPQWEIDERVIAIVARECKIDRAKLSLDSRLIEDLHIDSLDLTELVMAWEEEFDVNIPDDLDRVFTHPPVRLRDFASLIADRWGTGQPPRTGWRKPKQPPKPSPDKTPFTQYEDLIPNSSQSGVPLHLPFGENREGYKQYQRTTEGMRCILVPKTETAAAYLIDAETVSAIAYARFLNALRDLPETTIAEWCGVDDGDHRGQQSQLQHKRGLWEPIPGTEHQPMILVSWYGANAYSLWANGRYWRNYRGDDETHPSYLPTEAQWAYAAQGASADSAVVAQHASGVGYTAATIPSADVNARAGMSRFGLHHAVGNVWQWCRDWYADDPANPATNNPTGIRSERGGSWVGPAELAALDYRRGRPPHARGRCLGFRCVGDAPNA